MKRDRDVQLNERHRPTMILGTAVGVSVALLGYLMIVQGGGSYGLVIFFLLPILVGYSVALIVRRADALLVCLIVVGVLSSLFLIVTGLEGYICVAMAVPVMLPGMVLGACIGYAIRFDRIDHRKPPLVLLRSFPVLIAAEQFERPFRNATQPATFTTTRLIDASPETTWNCLTELPELSGPKPFLLVIGLPVPTHCTLKTQELGGERICVFDQGLMKQRVTKWEPAKRLQVEVTECTLPGRLWLDFVDAGYELTPTSSGTQVTRTSSIGSRLYPRWYWRPFEDWAVTSEHNYVLDNIQRRAEQ